MLTDNEDIIINLIIKLAKEVDEVCTINIINYTYSARLEIQTTAELRPIIFNKVKILLKEFKIPLNLTTFNKNKVTLLSFDFMSSNFKN